MYGLEDFIADSSQISKGKYAILRLEQNGSPDLPSLHASCDECVMDGDELTIALYSPYRRDHADAFEMINQTAGFRICDGKVALPRLGPIDVEGLTLNQLKEKIQTAYREEIPDGKIFINYKKRRARFVQIIGAEKGVVPVDGKMRLNEVLAMAVVPPSSNLFKSNVIRDGNILPVDLYKLIHEGDESQNIVMRGGDQIFIARGPDAAVMVTGEVRHPKVIPVPYGFLPLQGSDRKRRRHSFYS